MSSLKNGSDRIKLEEESKSKAGDEMAKRPQHSNTDSYKSDKIDEYKSDKIDELTLIIMVGTCIVFNVESL